MEWFKGLKTWQKAGLILLTIGIIGTALENAGSEYGTNNTDAYEEEVVEEEVVEVVEEEEVVEEDSIVVLQSEVETAIDAIIGTFSRSTRRSITDTRVRLNRNMGLNDGSYIAHIALTFSTTFRHSGNTLLLEKPMNNLAVQLAEYEFNISRISISAYSPSSSEDIIARMNFNRADTDTARVIHDSTQFWGPLLLER